jgi:hypothetical protein
MPPNLFAPYGEYADAFRLTADVRDDGRSGITGAPEADVVEDVMVEEGLEIDVPVGAGTGADIAMSKTLLAVICTSSGGKLRRGLLMTYLE